MARLGTDAAVDLARIRSELAASAEPAERAAALPPTGDADFERRSAANFGRLHRLFAELYGEREDALDALAGVVGDAEASWAARPDDLRALDASRERDPDWYGSNRMLGGVCYVDRYAGDLDGRRERASPNSSSSASPTCTSCRCSRCPRATPTAATPSRATGRVAPHLGTIDDLRALAAELRANGISLVLDFIFNHTASDHEWARKAVAGDPDYRDFYLIFPDRTMPDAYERTVREIFPDDHPGSFVQLPDGRWVWATFHSFQWDLNYANPAVFRAMAGEMLFLANLGVEVLRMDAVAFIWKQLGTACETLPEAHLLLQAFNAVLRMAAPVTALQVRGDRAPRRGRRVHLARGVPALVQPAADGAHVGGARHARSADAGAGARAPARAARRVRVGELRARPRRHRMDVRRRGRRRVRHRRLRPPPLPQRVLREPVPRQLRPGRAVPGEPAHGRCPGRGHDGVARGSRGGRCRTASTACCSPTPSPSRRAASRCIYLGDEVAQLNDTPTSTTPPWPATAAG